MLDPDQPGQALRGTATGRKTQRDLGLAKPGAARANAKMARLRQFKPAPGCSPV